MDPTVLPWLSSVFGPETSSVLAASGMEPPPIMQTPPAPPGWDTVHPAGEFGALPGASPAPAPMPLNSGFNGSGAPLAPPEPTAARPTTNLNQLTGALRGMVPPQVPPAQKVSTPAAPPRAAIKSGDFLNLMNMLNAGNAMKTPEVPYGLGRALSGRAFG